MKAAAHTSTDMATGSFRAFQVAEDTRELSSQAKRQSLISFPKCPLHGLLQDLHLGRWAGNGARRGQVVFLPGK